MDTGTALLDRPTLVLNRSWRPVFTVPARKAVVWLCREIAEVVYEADCSLHTFDSWASLSEFMEDRPLLASPSVSIAVPEIVKLVFYNGIPRHRVAFTRRALFSRDNYTCQYCGATPGTKELTIDHVIPLSRGGNNSWENCVLACVKCNAKKGSRLINEAGMSLLKRPVPPKWTPLVNLSRSRILDSWQNFISEVYWNVILHD